MKIKEFIQKYCKDLLVKNTKPTDPLDAEYFSYDYEVLDETTGRMEKVIFEDGIEILVRHIIEYLPEDFVNIYPNPKCLEMYNQYLKSFQVIYGEDVLMQAQKDMLAFKSKVVLAQNFDITTMHGGVDASSFSVSQG